MVSAMGTLSLRSRILALAAVGVAFGAGFALDAGAAPAKSRPTSIAISGPTHNGFDTSFTETVSGFAKGQADYVISGEQLHVGNGCARKYKPEAKRKDWYQWPSGTGAAKGKFSFAAQFYASHHGEHGLCSYLINSTSDKTFRHAHIYWTNS